MGKSTFCRWSRLSRFFAAEVPFRFPIAVTDHFPDSRVAMRVDL